MEDKIIEYIDKQTMHIPKADYLDVLERIIENLEERVEISKLELGLKNEY